MSVWRLDEHRPSVGEVADVLRNARACRGDPEAGKGTLGKPREVLALLRFVHQEPRAVVGQDEVERHQSLDDRGEGDRPPEPAVALADRAVQESRTAVQHLDAAAECVAVRVSAVDEGVHEGGDQAAVMPLKEGRELPAKEIAAVHQDQSEEGRLARRVALEAKGADVPSTPVVGQAIRVSARSRLSRRAAYRRSTVVRLPAAFLGCTAFGTRQGGSQRTTCRRECEPA